jgi:hypothetical protein
MLFFNVETGLAVCHRKKCDLEEMNELKCRESCGDRLGSFNGILKTRRFEIGDKE